MDLIGYIYSKAGEYRCREIDICLKEEHLCYLGQIISINHPKHQRRKIAFQVIDAPITLPHYVQNPYQLKKGIVPESNKEQITVFLKAKQLGYWEEKEIIHYLYPIEPLTPVYDLSSKEASNFLNPKTFSIEIGTLWPSLTYPLKLDVRMLIRKGLLILGGVGTGKTTTLLTLIHRLANCGLRIPFTIIDLSGELQLLAEKLGFFMVNLDGIKITEGSLPLPSFYSRARRMAGAYGNSTEATTLFAVLKRIEEEEDKHQFEWTREQWSEIRELIISKKIKEFWLKKIVIKEMKEKKNDIFSILSQGISIWIDCRGFDWDTIILGTSRILNMLFQKASSNPNFGSIIIIDEIHNIAPQRPSEAVGSSHVYKEALSVIKKVATMGARNLATIFATTQRVAEVNKTVSTQLGMNLFAHQVEDVDLNRLREMVGPMADVASQLSRGCVLIKSQAIPVRGPIIVKMDKIIEPASVAKDPIMVWGNGSGKDTHS